MAQGLTSAKRLTATIVPHVLAFEFVFTAVSEPATFPTLFYWEP